ncbi:MAG TPA: hypothetical protein VGN37_30560 [Actinocatenispora sp.]
MPSDTDDGFRALRSVDFLGGTEDLRRRLEEELRALGGRVPERFEVADPSGAVRLLVRRDGRVEGVEIHRERLPRNGFGAALSAAYVASVRESLNAQALASLADPAPPPKPAPAPDGPTPDGLASANGPADAPAPADGPADGPVPATRYGGIEDLSARIRRLADETSRRVEEAEALLARPALPEERTVHSPAGYVRLAVRGRRIVAITADEHRIPDAYVERLRTDVLAALRSAQHTDSAE